MYILLKNFPNTVSLAFFVNNKCLSIRLTPVYFIITNIFWNSRLMLDLKAFTSMALVPWLFCTLTYGPTTPPSPCRSLSLSSHASVDTSHTMQDASSYPHYGLTSNIVSTKNILHIFQDRLSMIADIWQGLQDFCSQ